MGICRLVIGKENAVAIMDIDDVNYQEQPTDKSEQQLSAYTTHHAGDMSKVTSLILFRRKCVKRGQHTCTREHETLK